jgi:hypothetical protein
MEIVCPNPIPWNDVYAQLKERSQKTVGTPEPPAPLILGGWAYSNDVQKRQRWHETVAWAETNGCSDVIAQLRDEDYYRVDTLTSYVVGPLGGPMYRAWDLDQKERPTDQNLTRYFEILTTGWPQIAGEELARVTRPIAFRGRKSRRLLVLANPEASPPWGDWSHLSRQETARRTFTALRAAINKAITPHEVDHVDFVTEGES